MNDTIGTAADSDHARQPEIRFMLAAGGREMPVCAEEKADGAWWGRMIGLYRPPVELTETDRAWLAEHLRLAGLRDDDPPPGSAAAAALGCERFSAMLRGGLL